MALLKTTFERLGVEEVLTYINSGNVIYTDRVPSLTVEEIEGAIAADFDVTTRVLIRDIKSMKAVVEAMPEHWVTDRDMRCDVLFLSPENDKPSIIDDLPVKVGVDNLIYVGGAVIWQVDAVDLNRSGRSRIVGGRLYKGSTVRNANTVRKLVAMMDS
jgi:uncharacterized protein (DUF1697 family)